MRSEIETRVRQARTTLIDALRLCDQGLLTEARVGCALAMVFLAPITNQQRAEAMIKALAG